MSGFSLIEVTHGVPLWLMGLIIAAVAELYAVGLMLLTRYLYGVSRLSLNNEVAGFKFAVVGVFYAVMLAFVVVAVWEDYRDTQAAVRDEAKAAVDLHQVSFALPDGGPEIRESLIAYVNDVRKHGWPAMGLGQPSKKVGEDLTALTAAVLAVKPQDGRQDTLFQHSIELLTTMTDNRNERLDSSDGSVPGILWFVLIAGGLITLGYPAFFAASNMWAQILMTASLAALVAMSLLLGLAFDFPFTGNPHISVYPFDAALEEMTATPPTR